MTYFQFDIMPDIVCLAKALGCGVPVGAFVANKKYGDAMTPGDHGSTYGGNPFVCAAVSAVFDIYEKDHIVEKAQEAGQYLETKLDELEAKCSHVIGHRGLGLMQGIVIDEPKSGLYVKEALAAGLIVVSAGADVVRLLPPLIITHQEIDRAMAILEKILK